MENILLLEDDENLQRGISFKLAKEGYHVFACSTVTRGMDYFLNHSIQLIICDITLEDGSGLDFCKNIRSQSSVHFLFLTAMDQELDVVMGYEAGADDYMTKPFSLSVLLSKVAALFKRIHNTRNQRICSGEIRYYVDEMKVFLNDAEIFLTKNEWKLLKLFLNHPRQVLTKSQILDQVFDVDGEFVDENTIAVNIRRLREKIKDHSAKPEYIRNIRGIGYIWDKGCQKE